MIEILIRPKYLYIIKNGKQIAYFEHFIGEEVFHTCIRVCSLDKKGDKFISLNKNEYIDCKIKFFGIKKFKATIMFLKKIDKKDYSDYLIIFK